MFCSRLKELDLFEPKQVQVDLGDGARISLSGFMAVDRVKLKALPAETLAELAKNDALELIYAHLHSMRHFAAIRERLGAGKPAAAAEPAAETESAASESRAAKSSRPGADKEPAGGKKR